MNSSIIQAFFIKIQPNMSLQEKKQQRIYDLFISKIKRKYFQNTWCFFMASIKLRL